jgi:hypothetical protein
MGINAKRNVAEFFKQGALPPQSPASSTSSMDYNDPPMVESPQPSPHTTQRLNHQITHPSASNLP